MVGVVAVVLVSAAAAFLLLGGDAEEVGVDEVIERERARDTTPGTDPPTATPRPAEGVYVYDAAVVERLSILGVDQPQGPTVPAAVRHEGDDCWTVRYDYSTNHWEEKRWCRDGDVLADLGGVGFQRFNIGAVEVAETTTFTCDPPGEAVRFGAEPGGSWRQACDGRSEERGTTHTSTGTNTFLGPEVVVIGGVELDALHYRLERTISGDQSGTEDIHRWYAADDGMLLRVTTDTRVDSPSPVGDITFTVQGEMVLTDPGPRS